jgi:CBS domain-containing protein
VAGKADWFANGLPREGKRTASPQIGDLLRRDVPVCHLDDRVDEVLQRVQTTGWDQCIVVNGAGVVLGLLRGEALHAAPDTPVELAMEAGPTTIRPDRSPRDIRAYMRQHSVASVVVTTPTGQLIDEAERRAWATVNKMTGGGKKSGSGRGKKINTAPAKKGGHKGGVASASRSFAERSASAKKAAQTRKRRAAAAHS